ncbi:hypothetical protein QUC31_011625 [Theobroma cacao]
MQQRPQTIAALICWTVFSFVKEMGEGRGRGRGRSEIEKERTKMRERQRRAITTNIFHGLRRHGGYHLFPRADINQVLRQLANEAGWVVEPDGTTYRSVSFSKTANCCPVCGAMKPITAPTPSSSVVIGGGECSTTASPRHNPVAAVEDPIRVIDSFCDNLIPIAPYMYGGEDGVSTLALQQLYPQEAAPPSQCMPPGSPLLGAIRRKTYN